MSTWNKVDVGYLGYLKTGQPYLCGCKLLILVMKGRTNPENMKIMSHMEMTFRKTVTCSDDIDLLLLLFAFDAGSADLV